MGSLAIRPRQWYNLYRNTAGELAAFFEDETGRVPSDAETVELKDEQMTDVMGGWNREQLSNGERRTWDEKFKKKYD